MLKFFAFCLFAILLFSGCKYEHGSSAHMRSVTKAVTTSRLVHADQNQSDWLSYGRNYTEDRFSSLKLINSDNVNQLGHAWSYDLGKQRGIEVVAAVLLLTNRYVPLSLAILTQVVVNIAYATHC